MVYEYGLMLDNLIKNKKVKIDTAFLTSVFNELLNGVRIVHNNDFVHLDIKPSNTLIQPGNKPILLDFGAIHRPTTRDKIKRSKVLSKGFSPIEQYVRDGVIGSWTDIYAIGATMRACLDGKPPPSATELDAGKETLQPAVEKYPERYPIWLLEAIDWAMELDAQQRPDSAEQLRSALLEQTGRPEKQNTTEPNE